MNEPRRRAADSEIAELILKVEQLDGDVKKLREDFDDHIVSEATKIELLNASLVTIQVKLDQLLLDIKEPLETYKATKAGMTFLKYVGETAKWLTPLIVGVILGYSNINIEKVEQNKPPITQGERK